jgi:hypothetical protein
VCPLRAEGDVVVVCVRLIWEVRGRGVGWLFVATLSSGAWRVVVVVMLLVWIGLFTFAGVGLLVLF